MAGTRPIPNNGIIKPSNARDGIVCRTAAIFITISEIRSAFVNTMPNGTAIKIAISNAIKEIWICSIKVANNSSLRAFNVVINSFMLFHLFALVLNIQRHLLL